MTTKIARTGTTPTNTTKYTWSAWIKRGALGNGETIVYNYQDGNNRGYIAFDGNDKMFFYDKTGSEQNNCYATRLFRDTGAWYHVHVKADSTLASNRFVVHINGVQEAITGTTIDQNDVLGFKTATGSNQHSIGANADSTANPFSGAMSHIHYVDGLALDYTEFGQTDSTTGEWKIKTPNVSDYGNNGYFILKDGNSVTDQSGQGNNWTVQGGTLTKTEDCPSNVFCTINPLSNKINFSLANGNTTLNDNGSDDNDNGIACTLGVNSGKYYWEMKKGSGTGGVHAVITDDVDIRLGNRATSSPDSQLWGFQSNGTGSPLVSYIAGTFNSTGNALQGWGANDIIGFALDMDNGKLYVSINGVFKGLDNNTSDPANGTNPAITGIPTGGKFIIPYFEKRSADSPETMCNFGNGYFGTTAVSSAGNNASGIGIFEYDVPTGYTALSTKGLNE